jgi:hypothetical protein
MQRLQKYWLFFLGSFLACSVMSLTTGCASGGWKLTRQYAGWLNSQPIILRVIIYILGFIIFFVTILVDVVVLNTMDFWEGKVSAGDYHFKDGDRTFFAHHEYMPGTQLKRSSIQVKDNDGKLLQNVVFQETVEHDIELFVDGVLRARGHDMKTMPAVTMFDAKGRMTQEKVLTEIDYQQIKTASAH